MIEKSAAQPQNFQGESDFPRCLCVMLSIQTGVITNRDYLSRQVPIQSQDYGIPSKVWQAAAVQLNGPRPTNASTNEDQDGTSVGP